MITGNLKTTRQPSPTPAPERADMVTPLLATLVIVIAVSMLCFIFLPSTKDFMIANRLWNGLANFSENFNATALPTVQQLPSQPAGKTLLSIAEESYSASDLDAITAFVRDGGKLVLADDYGYGNILLEHFNVPTRFSRQTLLDPLFCLGKPELPRITDFRQDIAAREVRSIVLNHATVLTGVDESDVMARSSTESYLKESLARGPFAVAASLKAGNGQVILLSDPSLFINNMMTREDNARFIQHVMSQPGIPQTYIDDARLARLPFDSSKQGLEIFTALVRSPPAALLFIGVIFTLAARLVLWRRNQVSYLSELPKTSRGNSHD